jgi:hypothetical protein
MSTEFIIENGKKSFCERMADKFYWPCYRGVRDIVSPIWYRFFGHKFHIIKTKMVPRSWIDTDERILYAVMDLVEWFVENDMYPNWTPEEFEEQIKYEKEELIRMGEPNDPYGQLEGLKRQYEIDQKILKVYNWWKKYPEREKEIENCQLGDKYFDLVEKLENEEDEMLKLAIEVRGAMWS